MSRHSTYESNRLVEALEAFWSPRRGASRLEVDAGSGDSVLKVTPIAELHATPWAGPADAGAEGPFKVR